MLIEDGYGHIVRSKGYDKWDIHDWIQSIRIEVEATPFLRRMRQTHEPILVEDTQESSEWVTLDETRWIRSHVGAPLVIHDQVLGYLHLDSSQSNQFTPEITQRLQAFADQVAIAIHNASLYEELAQYNVDLELEVSRRTAELNAAYQELKHLSELKDEFVSNVSHELRTPITSMKIQQHLLMADPSSANRHLEILSRETERLARIIEDLLHLSRLDQSNNDKTEWRSVNLNDIAKTYMVDRQPLAQSHELTLVSELCNKPPVTFGDASMIGQALSALLNNAINYAPAGGQVTLFTTTTRQNDRKFVGIGVRDTGSGIDVTELEKIFERFYRGEAARTTNKPGTGLGLSIAYEITHQHGGYISVKNVEPPETGAEFIIWLLDHTEAGN